MAPSKLIHSNYANSVKSSGSHQLRCKSNLCDSFYYSIDKGPFIKDIRTRGGRGICQKQTHADAGGGGFRGKKADVVKFKLLPKFSMLKLCSAMRQHLTE